MVLHFIALAWYIFLFIFLCLRGTFHVIKIWRECDTSSKIFQLTVNVLGYIAIGFFVCTDEKMHELYRYVMG